MSINYNEVYQEEYCGGVVYSEDSGSTVGSDSKDVFINVPPAPTKSKSSRFRNFWATIQETKKTGSDRNAGNANDAVFIYTGQDRSLIPRDITHVSVDSSVKVIPAWTFQDCHDLVKVKLCEGLQRIDGYAFYSCSSLERLEIPSSVAIVGEKAFRFCRNLTEVELNEGLEQISHHAFDGCTAMHRIKIPPTVKVIGEAAFCDCRQLEEVNLFEGLEKIEYGAFYNCHSLQYIKIPSTVQVFNHPIDHCDILSMSNVKFCILERVKRIGLRKWREELFVIWKPRSIFFRYSDFHSSLLLMELKDRNLKNAMCLLELAVWKSRIVDWENSAGSAAGARMRAKCRLNCGADAIIENVLSFLSIDSISIDNW